MLTRKTDLMTLHVKDAATLFKVPEKTLYRWIAGNELPHQKVGNQYRFNRTELLAWATERRVPISPRILEEPETGAVPALTEAFHAGGIHHGLKGYDKLAVLRGVVEALPLPPNADREFLLQVLLARESLGSTAIGGGIAIPHARHPIALNAARPLIALSFLENAIDFQAGDGLPVHILFTIVSPTIKVHLGLLARLAFGLRDSDFAATVARGAAGDEILQAAGRVDRRLAQAVALTEERRS